VPPSGSSATTSNEQQKAELSRMMVSYTYEQSHGSDAGALSALGRQIMASAKATGQRVTLPKGSGPAKPPASAGARGKVDLTV
jgi:hypothetical protein